MIFPQPDPSRTDSAAERIRKANAITAQMQASRPRPPAPRHVELPSAELVRAVAEAFGVDPVPTADHRVGCAVMSRDAAGNPARVTFDAPAQTRGEPALSDGLEEYREAIRA